MPALCVRGFPASLRFLDGAYTPAAADGGGGARVWSHVDGKHALFWRGGRFVFADKANLESPYSLAALEAAPGPVPLGVQLVKPQLCPGPLGAVKRPSQLQQ